MTDSACVPASPSFDLANHQSTSLYVMTWSVDSCSIKVATAPLKKPDLGKEITSVVTSTIIPAFPWAAADIQGKIQDSVDRKDHGDGQEEHVAKILARIKIDGSGDTTATLTISCVRPNKFLAKTVTAYDYDETKATNSKKLILGQPAPKHVITISYQNPIPIAGSAGALISTLGKKVYGVNTSVSSIDNTTNTATTTNTVAVTSSSNVQFVPFGFLHAYLSGSKTLNLNMSAGVGINPNGDKTQVEFFVGPSLGWHGLYLSSGVHMARAETLQGGFAVGQTVSGTTIATGYYETYKFGSGISYRPAP
jgi:hypothetical protein